MFRVWKTLEVLKIYNKHIIHQYSKNMVSEDFFTIVKNYFKCSCCCLTNDGNRASKESGDGRKGWSGDGDGDCDGNGNGNGGSSSPFSFDDLSNPLTPLTGSSSSSSLNEHLIYKRPKFTPCIGIIPSNYYSD